MMGRRVIKLDIERFGYGLPNAGGVYKIIACDSSGKPIPLNRIAGVDVRGVLYIGETYSIQIRIGDFTKSILKDYKTNNHSGGNLYYQSKLLCKLFPNTNFYVEYEECENHVEREKQILNEYFKKFGEYPPLNNSNG